MFRHPLIPLIAMAAAFALGAHYASVLAQESGSDAQRPTYYYGHYDPDTVARAPKPVKKPTVSPAPEKPRTVPAPAPEKPRIVPLPPSIPSPPARKPIDPNQGASPSPFPNQDASPSHSQDASPRRKPAHVSPDEQGPPALRRPALVTQPAAIKPLGVKESTPLFPAPEAIRSESVVDKPAAPSDPRPAKAGSPRSSFVTTAPAQDRTAPRIMTGSSPGLTALPTVNHVQPTPSQPLADSAFASLFPKSMFSKSPTREPRTPVPAGAALSSNANAQSRPVGAQPADANSVSPPSAGEPQPLVPKPMFVDADVAESHPATPTIASRFPSPLAQPKAVKPDAVDSANATSITAHHPRGLVVLPRSAKATPSEGAIAALAPLPQGLPTRVAPEVAPHPAAPTTANDVVPAENSVRAIVPGSEPTIVVVDPAKQRATDRIDGSARRPTATQALGEPTRSQQTVAESGRPKSIAKTPSTQRQSEVVAAPTKSTIPVTIGAPIRRSTANGIAPAKDESQTRVGFVFPKLLKVADSAQAERTAKAAAGAPARKEQKVVNTSSKKSKSITASAAIEGAKVADAQSGKSQTSRAAEMPVEPPPIIAVTEKDESRLPLQPNPMRSRQTYLVSKYAASIAAAPDEAPHRPKPSDAPLASAQSKSEKRPRANPVREMDRLSDAGRVNPLR